MKNIVYITLLLGLLSACKKDATPPVIQVTPDLINFSVNPGTVLSFDVSIESEEPLESYSVTSKMENGFTQNEYELNLNNKTSYSSDFEYLFTEEMLDQNILFTFTATSSSGLEGAAARRVYIVDQSDTAMVETTGHVIYSTFSGKNDGFDLETLSSALVATTDLDEIQIADYDSVASDSAMVPAWYSPAGAKFARFNDYDYASATSSSASTAFSASTQQVVITNITDGDIILVQYGNDDNIAVVRIEQVFQVDGSEFDRYNFSVKR